jgi:PBP1b-binding outer membrane lipoprotein LpoB
MRYIIIIAFVLFAAACTQNPAKPHNAREEAAKNGENILKPDTVLATNSPFMDSYLNFTETLVLAKDSAALISFKKFKQEITSFDATKTASILPEIAALKTMVNDSTITNVKTMRIMLKAINKPMLAIAKATSGFGKTIFNTHCPMAFNNKGGNWLSTKNTVRNPYFGNEMLECGYVQDSIK